MKKLVLVLFLLLIVCSSSIFALTFKEFDPTGVSYKAGPTGPSEELSIPWVEAVLYPKNVEAGKDFFVEVNLASPVREIVAELDSKKSFHLFSQDKTNWNIVIASQDDLSDGLHFLKVNIVGKRGKKITRTLAFRVKGKDNYARESYSFPLELKESGEKVEALHKQTFYWVKNKNGKKSWVEESKVEIPKREIFVKAYQSYLNKDYDKAIGYYNGIVMLDPNDADAHYWLAKSFDRVSDSVEVTKHLKETLRIDPSHDGANWLAGRIARSHYRKGRALRKMGKSADAIASYNKAVELRPASISYWMELGSTYQRMGKRDAAVSSWKQVLLVDPDNKNAHAFLHTDYYKLLAGEEVAVERKQVVVNKKPSRGEKEYIEVVKASRTSKGTLISSALKSVVSMTRSLGTKIYEDGWKTRLSGKNLLVTYICKQERLGKLEPEIFTFKVDLDNRKVEPHNKNARLLIHRW